MTLTENSQEVKGFAALISLPPGWCWIPFEEITINYDGKRVPITSSARKSGVFPYYGASGIIDYVNDYLFDGDYLLIAEDGANLLSRSTPIAFEANGKFWVNNHAHIVQVPGELIPLSYLKEYFNFTDLRFYISGSAQPKLNQKNLNRIEIPLPPLNEQHRIVAKIEALKARSQRVKEELEAIPALLDQFRQSVLAAAFRGDLTADWREKNPDVEPASVLLERIQEKRQKRYEEECKKAEEEGRRKPKDQTKNKKSDKSALEIAKIPHSWVVVRLEDASYLVTDGTHKTPKYQAEGVPFLSVKNVRPFLVKDEDVRFISEEEHQEINARCNPEKGDILYTKVGATFGYAAINQLDYSFSIFVSLALIKPVHPYFSSEYAEVIMNSEIVFAQARERVTGIGTPDLHLIEIRDFRIPLPPLEEQQEIVSRVKTFFKTADQVEQQYQEAKAYLEQLDQSILAKAFRGELVPQDPNDEPASVLLERIRAEREKLDTKKKVKSKTEKKSCKEKVEPVEPEQLSLPGFE